MRVLKNVSNLNINTVFRGRKVELKAKHSLTLLHYETDEEDRALFNYLLETYGFVADITERVVQRAKELKIKNKKNDRTKKPIR